MPSLDLLRQDRASSFDATTRGYIASQFVGSIKGDSTLETPLAQFPTSSLSHYPDQVKHDNQKDEDA
jgi:hypothetical protein